MATYRASIAFQVDSSLPKDVMTINPHFSGQDPEALAQALHDNLVAFTPTAATPFTIKIYDAATPPPSYPLATRTVTGTPHASGCPREIALCLSYFTTYNRPRFRGRLFIPATFLTSVVNVRPSTALQSEVLRWATDVLDKAMPPNTNWVVWSTIEKKAQGGVSDVWCDDEWDTVRSRGLAPTERVTLKL
jgi:hypothetical protein